MKLKSYLMTSTKILSLTPLFLIIALTLITEATAQETKQDPTEASSATQKQFATPKEAADSLIAAAETYDVAALKEILGPDGEDIVSSQDPVMDKNRAMEFAAQAKKKLRSRRIPTIRTALSSQSAKTNFPCQSRSTRIMENGLSTPRSGVRKSSTAGSARTSWMRSTFAAATSKRRRNTRSRNMTTRR